MKKVKIKRNRKKGDLMGSVVKKYTDSEFELLTKKAREIFSRLYREGKIDVYDPVR